MSKEILKKDRISLKKGNGGLDFLELRCNGAEAHIYLQGAHILHYQPADQQPVLWHSEASWFEAGKPIRGGIPVCWPWFGAHPTDADQPAHGYARIKEWKPISSSATEEATSVTLQFPESSCPKGISLQLTLELSDRLLVSLTTANNSGSDFNFSEALHSYFFIQNIHRVKLSGLDGQPYIDKLSHDLSPQEQKGPIEISSETDRIYINTTHSSTIVDEVFERSIHISKENSLSTVVWNPWIAKSIRMPDFGTSEFLNMLCVETANCGPNAVVLVSGETHKMNLQISAESD